LEESHPGAEFVFSVLFTFFPFWLFENSCFNQQTMPEMDTQKLI